jgi:hypothetical protein
MSKKLFPILGTEDVPLIGREALLTKIWGELTKASPANLSIVGPRYIGKSVLLSGLVQRACSEESPYALVIDWQLGYSPPQSDEAFIEALCDSLLEAMGADPKYADHRTELQKGKSLLALREVMDLLELDDLAVLMVWDGFDKPLSQGLLSGQLFGNLRDLFYGKKHRVVTATRKTQTELARNKQVEDSPFWNMFDVSPIRVTPFGDADVEQALNAASLNLSQGGKSELNNWSGGHPVLLLSVLNALVGNAGEITNEEVNEAAEQVAPELSEFMDKIWGGFDTDTKGVLRHLLDNGELDNNKVGKDPRRSLVNRGFAELAGGKLKPSCRMFSKHVLESKQDTGSLAQLFGTWDGYKNEIRSILDLRIQQIKIVNARLTKLVKQSLSDIPDYPDDCLTNLTRIEEVALDEIWKNEFEGKSVIPNALVAYWTQHPRDSDKPIKKRMEDNDWDLPRDRLAQLIILQRLTGSAPKFEPKAKYVSKDTYVLLNAIHQFRNRAEHADGQEIHIGVAVSAVLMCVELLSCLERELGA